LDAACRDERVRVAVWLLLRGAANESPPVDALRPPAAATATTAATATRAEQPHVTATSLRAALRRAPPVSEFRAALARALAVALADHGNFVRLVLPAVSSLPKLRPAAAAAAGTPPEQPPPSKSQQLNGCVHARNAAPLLTPPSSLAFLSGLEATVLAQVAAFVGVARGRRLRNLREAAACLATLQAEDEADDAASNSSSARARNGITKRDAEGRISDPAASEAGR
jgi:hypothetical protein